MIFIRKKPPNLLLSFKSVIIYGMKTVFSYTCVILMIIFPIGLIGALELEVSGGLNNFSWNPEKAAAGGVFEPYQSFVFKAGLKGDISKAWSFDVNIERDNILQNNIDFRLKTMTDNFGFEFGIFTGINDSFNALSMGISGALQLNWHGILYASIGGSSTIGSQFDFTGNNFRESAELKIGFTLPVVIPVLYICTKSYTENTDTSSTINKLDRFGLNAEFYFSKTSPVSFSVGGGYQSLTWTHKDAAQTADEISAIYAGFDIQYSVSKNLRFMLGGEIPLVVIPTPPLKSSEEFWMMFKAFGGVSIKFF